MTKKKTLLSTLFFNHPISLSLLAPNQSTQMNYLTVEELFKNYPEIKKEFKWKDSDIQEFFEGKLVIGKMDKGVLLISRTSFEDLIAFRKQVGKEA